MVVTISGAMRGNKLYLGKNVEIWRREEEIPYPGRVAHFSVDRLVFEVLNCDFEGPWLDEEITVRFTVPDDACYEFTGVVSIYNRDSHRLFIERLSSLKRIEKRGNYRMKTSRPVSIYLEEEAEGKKWREGVLLDISRTGARLLLPESPIKPGDIIKIFFNMDEVEHTLDAEAEVIHLTLNEDQVKLGVRFMPLPLPDMELLLEFILRLWAEKKNNL